MTRDPQEGLDSDGYLVTGADLDNVRPPYDTVLAGCRDAIVAALGDDLHGLYVYGSVATGQARPPASDLDLTTVVRAAGAGDRCTDLSAELSARYGGVVRDVGLGGITLEVLLAPTEAGAAERCFLKHYCVNVAGTDLRPDFPRCRPGPAIARGFIGDLEATIARFRSRLADATTPAEVEDVALRVGRKLLRSAAVLYSITDGGWTTDRAAGAAMIASHDDTYARSAALALHWADAPPGQSRDVDPSEVTAVLDGLGRWLERQTAVLLP